MGHILSQEITYHGIYQISYIMSKPEQDSVEPDESVFFLFSSVFLAIS